MCSTRRDPCWLSAWASTRRSTRRLPAHPLLSRRSPILSSCPFVAKTQSRRLTLSRTPFNDYGGIGFEFYSAVVRPYFEGLREKEEEAGGSGWDARKQKSEFLQRVSVTIAKGNSRVLDCMRHDWQSSTAPDLVTGTVHNPRTLAAT